MKAMVLHEQKSVERRPLVPVDVATPTPAGGEVLVRVRCCAAWAAGESANKTNVS